MHWTKQVWALLAWPVALIVGTMASGLITRPSVSSILIGCLAFLTIVAATPWEIRRTNVRVASALMMMWSIGKVLKCLERNDAPSLLGWVLAIAASVAALFWAHFWLRETLGELRDREHRRKMSNPNWYIDQLDEEIRSQAKRGSQ